MDTKIVLDPGRVLVNTDLTMTNTTTMTDTELDALLARKRYSVVIDAAEELATYLHAAGVAPTETAIRAALRAPRAMDLDRELAQGYLAACVRWGKAPAGGAAMLEGEDEGATRRPGR